MSQKIVYFQRFDSNDHHFCLFTNLTTFNQVSEDIFTYGWRRLKVLWRCVILSPPVWRLQSYRLYILVCPTRKNLGCSDQDCQEAISQQRSAYLQRTIVKSHCCHWHMWVGIVLLKDCISFRRVKEWDELHNLCRLLRLLSIWSRVV